MASNFTVKVIRKIKNVLTLTSSIIDFMEYSMYTVLLIFACIYKLLSIDIWHNFTLSIVGIEVKMFTSI